MSDDSKEDAGFQAYVLEYNKHAIDCGWPIYELNQKPIKLRDLLNTQIPRVMSDLERAEFRADYFQKMAKTMLPLAEAGFKKRKQTIKFTREGLNASKETGYHNKRKVLEAAISILENRNSERAPSDRDLARQISKKIGLPYETVRGHLKEKADKKKLG